MLNAIIDVMFIYYAIMTVNENTWEWQLFLNIIFFWSCEGIKDLIYPLSHRNALNTFHKIRRHLNEPRTVKPTNSIKLVMNRATYSSSQLSIKVSELHADANGRLEISCISTIPPKVGPGVTEYADFKSYSVKSKFNHLH